MLKPNQSILHGIGYKEIHVLVIVLLHVKSYKYAVDNYWYNLSFKKLDIRKFEKISN